MVVYFGIQYNQGFFCKGLNFQYCIKYRKMCRINSVCFISPESDKNKTAQLIEKEIVEAVCIWLCVPISFTST